MENGAESFKGLDIDELYILGYALDGYLKRLPQTSILRRRKATDMRSRVSDLAAEMEREAEEAERLAAYEPEDHTDDYLGSGLMIDDKPEDFPTV